MEATQAPTELRPMGIGDIFDATFKLYKKKFVTFLLISLVAYVPYAIVVGLYASAILAKIESGGQPEPGDILAGLVPVMLMAIIIMPLCQGAMIHTISEAYLGRSIGVGASYGKALPKLVRLLLANIIAGIIIAIGLVLLIVPGIIFMLWFILVTGVVMLEQTSATGALGRSKTLMSGNLGKGFLVLLVIGLLGWVFSLVLRFAVGALQIESVMVNQMIQIVAQAIIVPIQVAPIILLYYDLRIRKEAFDLEQLAEAMEAEGGGGLAAG